MDRQKTIHLEEFITPLSGEGPSQFRIKKRTFNLWVQHCNFAETTKTQKLHATKMSASKQANSLGKIIWLVTPDSERQGPACFPVDTVHAPDVSVFQVPKFYFVPHSRLTKRNLNRNLIYLIGFYLLKIIMIKKTWLWQNILNIC